MSNSTNSPLIVQAVAKCECSSDDYCEKCADDKMCRVLCHKCEKDYDPHSSKKQYCEAEVSLFCSAECEGCECSQFETCDECRFNPIGEVPCLNCEEMYDPQRSKTQYAKGSASMFCCSDCEADFNDAQEEEEKCNCCENTSPYRRLEARGWNCCSKKECEFWTCPECLDKDLVCKTCQEEEKPREDEQTCDECGDCGDFILHKSKVKEDHFVCCICKKAEEQ